MDDQMTHDKSKAEQQEAELGPSLTTKQEGENSDQ